MVAKSQTESGRIQTGKSSMNSEKRTAHDGRDQAIRVVQQQLRSLQLAGIDFLPPPSAKYQFASLRPNKPDVESDSNQNYQTGGTRSVDTNSSVRETRATSSFLPEGYESEILDLSQRVQQLESVNQEVEQCKLCSELASCRTKTVFGVGNPQAELCFLGEGPGADEDRQGEPFVGRAGQLLDKIIAACNMKRQDVYILNTIKCRPPGNRNPNEPELENCWPYAIRQLELIQPKFICCLGSVAARTLLRTTQSIGRMRGQFFKYRGSQVVVTYHPAYLLRNPSAKRQVWDDMKMLMAAMGREI